jgi:hypothetical protein
MSRRVVNQSAVVIFCASVRLLGLAFATQWGSRPGHQAPAATSTGGQGKWYRRRRRCLDRADAGHDQLRHGRTGAVSRSNGSSCYNTLYEKLVQVGSTRAAI